MGMDKLFHPFYWACNYLSMLGFKLIHVRKSSLEYKTLLDQFTGDR